MFALNGIASLGKRLPCLVGATAVISLKMSSTDLLIPLVTQC